MWLLETFRLLANWLLLVNNCGMHCIVSNHWTACNNPYIFLSFPSFLPSFRVSHALLPCILHTFRSVNPPHWQWPAPMGSWRVYYCTVIFHNRCNTLFISILLFIVMSSWFKKCNLMLKWAHLPLCGIFNKVILERNIQNQIKNSLGYDT